MKLSISKPCHENWNEMTVTQKGKFCGSCQIEVTDFSKMTKIEIKEFFINNATNNICGRFEARQIAEFNRPEVKTRKRNSKPWWIAAATILLFAKQGFTQGRPIKDLVPFSQVKTGTLQGNPIEKTWGVEIKKESLITVSGQILSEEGEPLFGALIRIKATRIGCQADFDGKFKLVVPPEHQDSLLLEVVFLGYEKLQYLVAINSKSKNVGVIRFKESQVHLLGEYVIVEDEEPTQARLFRRLRLNRRNKGLSIK